MLLVRSLRVCQLPRRPGAIRVLQAAFVGRSSSSGKSDVSAGSDSESSGRGASSLSQSVFQAA